MKIADNYKIIEKTKTEIINFTKYRTKIILQPIDFEVIGGGEEPRGCKRNGMCTI